MACLLSACVSAWGLGGLAMAAVLLVGFQVTCTSLLAAMREPTRHQCENLDIKTRIQVTKMNTTFTGTHCEDGLVH